MSGKAITKHLSVLFATTEISASFQIVVGFARSLLAAGMLLTLLFNDLNFLIPPDYIQSLNLVSLKYRLNFFLIFNPSHLFEAKIIAVLILGFVITGYFIKLTSLLQFWITASFFLLRPVYFAEGDNINMLLTLLLIPVCLFDERKNHWEEYTTTNKLNKLVQSVFIFLIKLQVAFIYYDSFHDKLKLKEWINGTVIYYWFTHNFFGLHPVLANIAEPFLRQMPVLLLIAWGSLTLELLLGAALLFSTRLKLWLLKCGILFHLCIMLVHGYASFFLVMSAALFLYLYPSQKSFQVGIFNNEK